ncbi:hypothetical protein F5Y08DRAFT_301405 [Xylaria arbuscula]|nr:hypothetical protein F5Y08DRAFT_301405 [Xylaria arbuscula]
MSFSRTYVPLGLAIVFGIANGYYAFQPYLKAQHDKSDLIPKSSPPSASDTSKEAPK